MKYFLKGKLKRDGRKYRIGDTIDLTDAEARLLAHVLQTEPVEAPEAPAEAEVPTPPAPEVSVGGERMETGEPSIDGGPEPVRTEAVDVTPVTGTPETPAEEAKPETPQKRGQSGRGKQGKAPQAAPADVKPPVDPSKDL